MTSALIGQMKDYGLPLKAHSSSIGVVYLARFAEGIDAFKRFAESYRRHPAGCEHDLVVLYKGFTQHKDLQDARQVFCDLPHIGLELEDVGFDIGSYLETSRRVSHQRLLFMNTYTELAVSGWLKHLTAHATRDGVGITGAMGSYESLFNSFAVIQSVIWMCNRFQIRYDKDLHRYCDFIIDLYCRDWCAEKQADGLNNNESMSTLRRIYAELKRSCVLAASCAIWWSLTRPGQVFSDYRQFPPFPNPHIRSNGFMVRRDSLLRFDCSQIQSKLDACAFESGPESLTTQLRKAGLSAITVDRDGRGYDMADWWRGRLFRLGDQEGLLLTDNQSRSFDEMSAGARATHIRMTWGDYLSAAPNDFPRLAFRFRKGSLSTKRIMWMERLRSYGLSF